MPQLNSACLGYFSQIYIYVWHTCSCSDLFCSASLNLHNANTHPNILVSVLYSKYCSGVLSAHTDFYISDSVWRRSCILPHWPSRHDLVTCNSCHFSPLTPFGSDATFDFFAAPPSPLYLLVYITFCFRLYFVLPFAADFSRSHSAFTVTSALFAFNLASFRSRHYDK